MGGCESAASDQVEPAKPVSFSSSNKSIKKEKHKFAIPGNLKH